MVSKLEERVREALKDVVDPELGINVVDLGLIRGIERKNGKIVIKMVLTTPFCPIAPYMFEMIEKKAKEVEGVEEVEIKYEEGIVWTPEMMSEETRKKLGI